MGPTEVSDNFACNFHTEIDSHLIISIWEMQFHTLTNWDCMFR